MIKEHYIQNIQTTYDRIDQHITRWMAHYSLIILRISLGLVFIWFGALKLFPGLSPAEELVRNTIYFFDANFFLPILAIWEVLVLKNTNSFHSPIMDIAGILLPRKKPTNIHRPEVLLWIPLVHPLGNSSSHTGSTGNTH